MRITVLAVGRKLSPAAQTLSDEYLRRLRPWCPVDVRLVPPGRKSGSAAVAEESERLLAGLKERDYVIVVDERGTQFTNDQFASRLAKVQEYIEHLVIIIGGAHGVSAELRERAALIWSLSLLVFPHELVRIILLEQLYRTFAILNHHPYHHA